MIHRIAMSLGAHDAQVIVALVAFGVVVAFVLLAWLWALREPHEVRDSSRALKLPLRALSPENRDYLMQAWKTTIEVQTHFNGMLQSIRVTGLSVALAIAGAGLATIGRTAPIRLGGTQAFIHPAALVELCAMTLILGLMFFETYFYALLLAAVRHAEELEKDLDLGLTTSISREVKRSWAHNKMRGFWLTALIAVGLIFLTVTIFSSVLITT